MLKKTILFLVPLMILGASFVGIYITQESERLSLGLQTVIFTALSGLSNLFLAFVAFWQLPAIEKTNKASEKTTRGQFLMELYKEWMQEDVLAARCFLHSLALTYKNDPSKIAKRIGQSVLVLSEDKDAKHIRIFSQIVSLLEFLETLGTLYQHGHIELIEIEQLFGGSIERYYSYLSDYIHHRRILGSPSGVHFLSDQLLYARLDDLVLDLKNIHHS